MANIRYMQQLCKEYNFAPAEVVEVLRTSIFNNKVKNGERDTSIMRDLTNGLSYLDISEAYHLSVARIKEIEKSCRRRLPAVINRRRFVSNCIAIEDTSDLAGILECEEATLTYVLSNPELCLKQVPEGALPTLMMKTQGGTISNIATAQNITGEDAIIRLVRAVEALQSAVRVVSTESKLWDTESAVRSVSRMCKQWDVTKEELQQALDDRKAVPALSEKGRAILVAWVGGRTAAETCKETGTPYADLNRIFKAEWPVLRERLRARKMEHMRAEAVATPGVRRMNLGL